MWLIDSVPHALVDILTSCNKMTISIFHMQELSTVKMNFASRRRALDSDLDNFRMTG